MQPLIPGFINSFSFPVSFVQRLEVELDGHQPESVVLVTTEDPPRRHWYVKLEGGRYFKDGWKEFSDDHGLHVGDFVVFNRQSNLLFHVSVYDPLTTCERQFSLKLDDDPKLQGVRKENIVKFNGESTHARNPMEVEALTTGEPSSESHYPRCDITLTSHSIKRADIYFPMSFVRSNGLRKRSCLAKIVDGKGRAWQVKLNYNINSNQTYICQGWKDFMVAKKLKLVNVICFEVLSNGIYPTLKRYRLDS